MGQSAAGWTAASSVADQWSQVSLSERAGSLVGRAIVTDVGCFNRSHHPSTWVIVSTPGRTAGRKSSPVK